MRVEVLYDTLSEIKYVVKFCRHVILVKFFDGIIFLSWGASLVVLVIIVVEVVVVEVVVVVVVAVVVLVVVEVAVVVRRESSEKTGNRYVSLFYEV